MTTPSTRASARPPAQPGDGFARQGLARRGERRRRFRTRRRWRARPWVAILLPYLGEADATGTDALTEYEVLRRRGLRVTLHAPQFEPVWASLIRPPVDAARAHILIYHHAVYWPEGEEILRRHRGRVRILRYHNVTPPEFFAPYSPVMAADLAEGRAQTARLVRLCTHWTADSHFSLHELLQAGAVPRRATVLPPFHQAEALRAAPADPAPGEVLADAAEGVVLFVGRPTKGCTISCEWPRRAGACTHRCGSSGWGANIAVCRATNARSRNTSLRTGCKTSSCCRTRFRCPSSKAFMRRAMCSCALASMRALAFPSWKRRRSGNRWSRSPAPR